jgi:glycogen operon protein
MVDDSFLIVFNASELDLPWTMPDTIGAKRWTVDIDSAEPDTGTRFRRQRVVAAGATIDVTSRSIVVLRKTA